MMSNLKRAIVSLVRQPVKSSIFLILVFILGVLIAGAISVHHAIMHTNQNLRSRMPAVAMVEYNFDFEYAMAILEETGEWPMIEIDTLTREIVHEIGTIPQVSGFDFTITVPITIAPELEPWVPLDYNEPLEFHYRMESELGVEVLINGVETVDFLDIRSSFMELVDGRSFTSEELMTKSDQFPVLISSGFAETNGLTMGSIFDVRIFVVDFDELTGATETFLGVEYPLEVIGIFDPIPPDYDEEHGLIIGRRESRFQHRMYISNLAAQEIVNELLRELPTADFSDSFQNLFLLNDPLDFEEFDEAVRGMPGNWRTIDYSMGFDAISLAMVHLQDIANVVLLLAIVATIAIIGLLVLLFLNDRKHEIGVYLALGAKKKGIIFQVAVELVILALIGMTCALLVGNVLARNISQEMLRQELTNPTHVNEIDHVHWLEELGYRFAMTHEEMLVAYEIQLGVREVVWFYVAGLGTVLIATILPIAKIVQTNPKKVLL